jgi:hypothetical protein
MAADAQRQSNEIEEINRVLDSIPADVVQKLRRTDPILITVLEALDRVVTVLQSNAVPTTLAPPELVPVFIDAGTKQQRQARDPVTQKPIFEPRPRPKRHWYSTLEADADQVLGPSKTVEAPKAPEAPKGGKAA